MSEHTYTHTQRYTQIYINIYTQVQVHTETQRKRKTETIKKKHTKTHRHIHILRHTEKDLYKETHTERDIDIHREKEINMGTCVDTERQSCCLKLKLNFQNQNNLSFNQQKWRRKTEMQQEDLKPPSNTNGHANWEGGNLPGPQPQTKTHRYLRNAESVRNSLPQERLVIQH